jgi:cysteine desulfurase
MLDRPIYMDNHATTRVDPRVVEAMLPFFNERYGNSGSINHPFGWEAKDAVEAARESIARAIGADAREIVFTSGATESNNLAIRGVAEFPRKRGNHLVSVKTEHKAVLDPLARLSRRGCEVTLVDVLPAGHAAAGCVEAGRVLEALRDDTVLVSVMLANNEVGSINPVTEIAVECRKRGVLVHCDATQAVGKMPVDAGELGVDLLSFSAHKIYGPKGVGALYVRRKPTPVRLEAQIAGGGQEHGLRSGTANVPGIVGFAAALELCVNEMAVEQARLRRLRDRLFRAIRELIEHATLNGPALEDVPRRLAGNLNVSFAFVDGEALMMSLKNLAVSSGAACTSVNPEPSHVLRAMGLPDDLVRASLRFGLGRFNTDVEVDLAVPALAEAVSRLRQMSSMAE